MFRLIWGLLFFVSCSSVREKAEVNTDWNESDLLQFVQNSASKSEHDTLRSLDSLLAIASKDSFIFCKTVSHLTKLYSDPNSSFRNEILYDKILRAKMVSKWSTDLDKKEANIKCHLLHQNDGGNVANDFEYWAPNGEKRNMHSIKAEYLLLFFYNPECNACKEMKSGLMSSSLIRNASVNGKLKILSVYTDADLSVWYKHLLEFPSSWIQGRDNDEYLYKNNIYDLKAIPSIYLLDQNKKVILKDCTSIRELEEGIQ